MSGSNDVQIVPGYIGLGDFNRDIIVRFNQPLPDDKYRIEVLAYDNKAYNIVGLKNVNGALLNPTTGDDRDVTDFELDLGTEIIAVVPQPVVRVGASLAQSRNTVEVYFNEDDQIGRAHV